MHHAATVHHRHLVAQLPCEVEVLLHQQDGGVRALELAEGHDHVLDDGRRQALAGLVDEQQLAGLDDGPGHRQHLLLATGQEARRVLPEPLHGREQAEDPLQTLGVHVLDAPGAPGGEDKVLGHGEVREDAHVLRHIGDAGLGDLRRGLGSNVSALEVDGALGGLPEAHDGAQGGGLAGAVAAQQHGELALGHLQVHAVEDVVGANVGVDALELQQGFAHLATSTPR